MERTNQYLSEKERAIGRRQMLIYEIYNGISMGLLGETLVYILAVRFCAGNLILGFIPTAIYATSLLVPFFSKFLEGKNLGRTLYINWYLRGFVCLFYSLILFTTGNLRIFILIFTFVMYMFFRAIGIISYDPIAKNLTTFHSRGKYYSTLNYSYNATMMIAKLVSSIILYFYDSLYVIVLLQTIGIIGNTFASYHSKKIPCRLTYSKSSDMNFFVLLFDIFKNGKIRNRVLLKWIYFSVIIIMGMTIPFMSIKVGLSDGFVIIYSVIISLAYIFAGYVSRLLSDATGARPILIISSISTLFFSGIFIFSPADLSVVFLFLFGFLLNFFIQIAIIQSNQLVVSALPDKNSAGYNIIINFGAGLLSIIAGLLSGLFVSFGEKLNISLKFMYANDYSLCFIFGFAVSILGLIYTITLKEKNAKKAIELMSLKNLHAISQLSIIENSMSSFYRRKHIMDLAGMSSNFIYGEVHKKLLSPYSREIHDLLQVIGEKKWTSYIPDCINIAENDDNYMQITAIEALANFSDNLKVAQSLEKIFYNSKWVSAKASAAKALSQFDNEMHIFNDVKNLAKNAIHIETCIDCMIAEFHLDSDKKLFLDIFSPWSIDKNQYFKQTRYSCFDVLLINKNALSKLARIYEEINSINYERDTSGDKDFIEKKKDILKLFLDDCRNIDVVDKNYDKIINSIICSDIENLNNICEKLLDECVNIKEIKIYNCAEGLKKFRNLNKDSLIESDLIAYLYFCIFVRNNFEENNEHFD